MNDFTKELFKEMAQIGYYDLAWRLGSFSCAKDLQEWGIDTQFMSPSEIFNVWVEKKLEDLNNKQGE